MALRPSRAQARIFAALLRDLEPSIRRGFMASVTDLRSNVEWGRLIMELTRGNVDGAIAALNIDPVAWNVYSESVADAYGKAGAATAAYIQTSQNEGLGIRFNMRDPVAEEWIRENVGEQIVGIAADQVKAVREVIEAGQAAGDHPRTIALDIVGRRDASGIRSGGILGLDGPRARRYYNVSYRMRTAQGVRELVVVGNDGRLRMRYKVNKATEQRILKAYHKGESVPLHERIVSERQYYNALLKARGDTIAQTETGNAVMSGRNDAWEQAAQQKGMDKTRIVKTWQHRRGATKNHRPDHLAMSGVSVVGLDAPFVFPDGARLLHAHDPAGGPQHVINCGCDTEYSFHRVVG